MDRRLIAVFAVMAMVIVAVPMVGDSESDAAGEYTIPDDATLIARGTCGSGTGAASWSYDRSPEKSELSIGSGSVGLISSTTDKWVLTYLKIGSDAEITDLSVLANYKIAGNVLESRVALELGSNVTASSGAMKALGVTSVKFTGSSVKVADGLFSGCTTLRTVDLTNVSTVGKSSFEGTSLQSVDLKSATIDFTSFKDCASLKTFTATNSTVYKVNNSIADVSLLMSDGGKTVFMCAPGTVKKAINISSISGVTKVNLCYADVVYIVDEVDGESGITFVTQTGSTEHGLRFSSLGMQSVSFTYKGDGVLDSTFRLYSKGWGIESGLGLCTGGEYSLTTPELSTDPYRFTLKMTSSSGVLYPMGVATLTYKDLASLDSVGDWKASASSIPTGSGVVKEIDPLEVTVTGYVGTTGAGEIGGTMLYHGVQCKVVSIKATPGAMVGLTDLIVEGDVTIGSDAFANCSTLVSITANDVKAVGDRAFRYCTKLETASLTGCGSFGAGAFESCLNLEVLDLGAAEISFGDDALAGCKYLELLTVGLDSTVTGVSGIPVLHYDTSVTDASFQVIGDQILIFWDFGQSLTYSTTKGGSGETVQFYYGDKTVIPISDQIYISVAEGPLQTAADCLVVFDKGLGMDADSTAVDFGGTVARPGDPFKLGYTFLGWTLDGEEYDFSTPVKETIVLTAEWAKENEIDMTPMYLMVIFGASIAATAVMLAIARKQ